MSTGAFETSVFHALSGGKIAQLPIVGLLPGVPPPLPPVPGAASPPGDAVRTVTRRTFAQRCLRHARTE